ncbi:hypothetical protein Pr1d_06800 [Bythopirellula goksoeyrii]|uniref:Glycosyl hydrolase family 32 N-terminal domain-containing protein n=2 Tax=Bythopirellula goksoeyrii TaxID=1400387 RepID=A0A5B9Q372_9BACT|nr:hypothetical protein Pr1d_06800 [Bythopirellula goksoeyrii]
MVSNMKLLFCLLLQLSGSSCCYAVADSQNQTASVPIEIGTQLQLFLDDKIIDETQNVDLKLNSPRRAEIAIKLDMPWEDSTLYDPVVILDGSLYRMWYRANFNSPPYYTGYAESEDGIHWTKPSLGLIEYQGSTDNNLVWVGDHTQPEGGPTVLCVFKDDSPTAHADQLYKATGYAFERGLQGLVSPDGLHWRLLQKERVVPAVGEFDTHSIAFWDAAREQYVVYTRGFEAEDGTEVMRATPYLEEHSEMPIRRIRRTATKDFRHFTAPKFIEVTNHQGTDNEHLYKNAATPYYRRPDILLMFPKRFVEHRKGDEWPLTGISDIVFMSSRDGIRWDRRFGEAFLRPGNDPLNWHERAIEVGPGLVPTGSVEMSLYFVEHYRTDSVHIRRGVLRVDGIVSVHAGYQPGEFVTRPIVFEGNRLILNFATSAAGSIQVEVLNSEGQPVEGLSLADCPEHYGDDIERVVTWDSGSDLSRVAGLAVRLRFAMKDADLYSLRFSD